MEGPNKFCEKKDRSCDQGKEVKIKDSEIYRRPVLVGFFWSVALGMVGWGGWLKLKLMGRWWEMAVLVAWLVLVVFPKLVS